MEQTCRICYATDHGGNMLTPCNCRGTSAFIHQECLERYLEHYPDGICRVCLVRMRVQVAPEIGTALGTLVLSVVILNNAVIPVSVKLGLLIGTTILIRGLGLAGLLSFRLLLVITGMSLLLIAAQNDVHSLIAMNVMLLLVGTVMTLGLYVELEGILACAVAIICYLYAVFMTLRILFEVDVWTNIAALNFLFMGWYTWYMSRQPLFAPVPL